MAAIACPLCLSTTGTAARTRVYDTRRDAAANAVRRYRRCPGCRAVVVTVEQVAAVRPPEAAAVPLVVGTADGS